MGRQIIKQPNGKYCVFSSIVDNFIWIDGTKEQIINAYVEEASLEIRKRITEEINEIESGENPYYQFKMTFEKALEAIENVHGSEEKEKVLKIINSK